MNRVVHFEIMADDVARAKQFYSSVFGWEMQQMGSEFGDYVVIKTGPGMDEPQDPKNPGINGGLMKRNAPLPADGHSPNAYTCVIGVDNIDTYITKIEAAGGKPQTEKMDVPGVGKIRYYKDTEGNIFCILEPEPMMSAGK